MAADRLAFLEKLTAQSPQKALAWYGLAMEHRSRGTRGESLAAFEKCIAVDTSYVPAYFQCAMMLDECGERDAARARLTEGIRVAERVGDAHAAGEMRSQLELWDNF